MDSTVIVEVVDQNDENYLDFNYRVYNKIDQESAPAQHETRPFLVNTHYGSCSCLKPISHGYPCKHLIKVIRYRIIVEIADIFKDGRTLAVRPS